MSPEVVILAEKNVLLVPKIILMFLHNKPFSFCENNILMCYSINVKVLSRYLKFSKLKLYFYLKEDLVFTFHINSVEALCPLRVNVCLIGLKCDFQLFDIPPFIQIESLACSS